jgi:PST family polysaccharide transporter
MIGGIISIGIIVGKFQLNFGRAVPVSIYSFLKRDRQIYISTLFMNLYRNSNILILSIFVNEVSVGIYSAGEKIIKAVQGAFTPITQAFYPYISRITTTSKSQSQIIIKYTLILVSILTSTITILFIIFSENISHLAFGKEYQAIALIIKIASPAILFGVINFVVGIIFMTNYSMKNEFTYSVIIVGILNIVTCSILSLHYEIIGAAVSFILAEILLLFMMYAFIVKNKEKWKVKNGE